MQMWPLDSLGRPVSSRVRKLAQQYKRSDPVQKAYMHQIESDWIGMWMLAEIVDGQEANKLRAQSGPSDWVSVWQNQ